MSIYKDDYFESILKKLKGSLDADLFEKCVVDVLRKNDFPTLVPIPGGQDSGMDGALSDKIGNPIPLVTTTNKSPISNLEKNLSKYIEDGGKRREVIFATSVDLTAQRIKNLYKKANDLGFNLIQVYEQQALAMRLYHEPSWCKNLLGLSGKPRALSKIPINARSIVNSETIGRDFEKQLVLEKISLRKDMVVLGQPGIGKTFLLSGIVESINAFFLNSDDRERVYGDIRELNPDTIIVDDAHIKIDLIKELIHFRKENTVNFNLICITWPSHKEELLSELEITEDNSVELRLLGRNDIVKIIHECGISGPNNLIWHLVNQSSGKPGLSAMLSRICLSGGMEDFVSGRALRRVLLSSIKKYFGSEVEQVLAYFSFMGEVGASFQDVSGWSGVEKYKLHRLVSDLALLGILKEVRDNKLAVVPEELRFVLVRDNFFRGAISLESSNFFEFAETQGAVVEVLIGVFAKGGQFDEDILYRLVKKHNSKRIFNMYAGLGRREVLKLLADFPDRIDDFLTLALHYASNETVPLLLNQVLSNPKDNLHSLPEHPARRLQDWVSQARSGDTQVIDNKKILLKVIINKMEGNDKDKMLYEIIPSIFSPSWNDSESDPGAGMTITLTNGYYSAGEIKALGGLWNLFFKKLSTLKLIKWEYLLRVLNNFAYPNSPRIDLPEKVKNECRALAKQIIDDLYIIGNKHQGVCLKLINCCEKLRYRKSIQIDDDFRVLFPKESLSRDYKKVEREYSQKTEQMVEKNQNNSPEMVLTRLQEVHNYATDVGRRWPDQTSYYAQLLSTKVKYPKEWLYKGIELGISPQYLAPFLSISMNSLDAEMENKIIGLLDTNYFWVICSSILLRESSTELLVEECLERLDKRYSQGIEGLFYCLIPIENAKKLLAHKCMEIKEASAIGEYLSGGEERGQIRTELRELWEQAIVDAKDEEYWLKEILQKNSDLAFLWIKKRVNNEDHLSYHERETFKSAMNVVAKEHSVELIGVLKENYSSLDKVKRLVGTDRNCFKALLQNSNLRALHLVPLEKKTGEALIEFTKLSLEHGYSEEDIASSVFSMSGGWYGKESEMISGKIKDYQESLKLANTGSVRNVIELVISFFENRKVRALREEQDKEIYGRF